MPAYFETSTLTSIVPGIYRKQTSLNGSDPRSKPTVFIFSWMGASPRAVAKYVDGYVAHYPHSDLYLITSSVQEWTFGSYEAQRQSLGVTLIPILNELPPEDIIVAIFSNGGTQKLTLLAETYREQQGRPLLAHTIILDSCPGKSDFERGVPALAQGLPQNPLVLYPGKAIIYSLIAAGLAYCWVFGTEDPNGRGGRILNDPDIVDTRAPRVYIFSKKDGIVGWKDVVAHAAEAKEKGIKVSLEEFEGSQHTGHLRINPERYWRIVSDL